MLKILETQRRISFDNCKAAFNILHYELASISYDFFMSIKCFFSALNYLIFFFKAFFNYLT